MNVLIIGGTSGLGLELAKRYRDLEFNVFVTGRRDTQEDGIEKITFELHSDNLPERIEKLVDGLPDEIDVLVYAAGIYQEGKVDDLTVDQIEEMIDVGGRGLIYSVRALLKKQGKLDELVTITSTSAWIPRQLEPIYNFVKAGAGHVSNGFAEDGRINKTLVAGPAGMDTDFYKNSPRDMSVMLDPAWVADEIMKLREEDYTYRFAKILREPPRVLIEETR